METTSKTTVRIPLVAAIPINFFSGKIDSSAKSSKTSSRIRPYIAVDIARKSCSSCNKQETTHHSTAVSGKQTTANIKISNMYNGSPMLILPFVPAKPSQIQQKALPSLYNQHQLSLYHPLAKKSDDSSRVIWNLLFFSSLFPRKLSKYFFYFNEFSPNKTESLGENFVLCSRRARFKAKNSLFLCLSLRFCIFRVYEG